MLWFLEYTTRSFCNSAQFDVDQVLEFFFIKFKGISFVKIIKFELIMY